MADKQPYLNSNFYGPAVPPPSKSHGRRRILCTILKVAIGFIVGIGILLLILGLVYRPDKLEFNVISAKLTQFNVTDNKLFYKLALNITIHNPNKRYGVYYDSNNMDLFYKNRRLNIRWLPPFFQDTKTTVVVSPDDFEGQREMLLTGDEIVELNAEKAAALYPFDVKFFFRLRMKSDKLVLKYKPKVYCGFKVPLSNGPNSFVFFPNTACDFTF